MVSKEAFFRWFPVISAAYGQPCNENWRTRRRERLAMIPLLVGGIEWDRDRKTLALVTCTPTGIECSRAAETGSSAETDRVREKLTALRQAPCACNHSPWCCAPCFPVVKQSQTRAFFDPAEDSGSFQLHILTYPPSIL